MTQDLQEIGQAQGQQSSTEPAGRAAPVRRYAKPVRHERLANHRHEMFVIAYLANGRNGTQAAISVGYSKRSAQSTATEILSRPLVKARLRALVEESYVDAEMGAREVLARLAHVARFDVRKLYDAETGEAKQIKDLDEATAAAIVSFETELLIGKDGGNIGVATRKIKAADKIAALKILAEHHGLIGSDASQAAGALVDALADRMEAARQRSIAQAEADRARTIEAEPRVITDDEDVPK